MSILCILWREKLLLNPAASDLWIRIFIGIHLLCRVGFQSGLNNQIMIQNPYWIFNHLTFWQYLFHKTENTILILNLNKLSDLFYVLRVGSGSTSIGAYKACMFSGVRDNERGKFKDNTRETRTTCPRKRSYWRKRIKCKHG